MLLRVGSTVFLDASRNYIRSAVFCDDSRKGKRKEGRAMTVPYVVMVNEGQYKVYEYRLIAMLQGIGLKCKKATFCALP